MERNRMGYKFCSLMHLLAWVIIFPACHQEEEGIDMPMYEQSDVPISFSMATWESRQAELDKYPELRDPSKEGFNIDDKIGVFSYYLKGGYEAQISNLVPNFMYNQKVTYTGLNWDYSPIKYWSNTQSDKFRFCAYYPYNDPTLSLSSNRQEGLPTLTYTMANDKTAGKVDLLYADEMGQKMSVDNSLLLNFKHLLGKIQFHVSIEKPTDGTVHGDGCELYRALIQAVKFKANWTGDFRYQYDNSGYPVWNIPQQEKREFLQLTKNPAGELINCEPTDESKRTLGARIVHDFTAFLLPVTIDEIAITVNNMTATYPLQNVEIKAGMVTQLNVKINLESGARFYATFSRWEEGGDLNYDLQ